MKRISISLILTLILGTLGAQSLSRQVISSTGNDDPRLTYTLGETVVETAITGSFVLTQGFQQPDATAVNVRPPLSLKVDYKFYPNPAKEKAILELNSKRALTFRIDVIDVGGSLVLAPFELQVEGLKKQSLDLSGLASGAYLLRIIDLKGNTVESIKFNKLN